MWDTCPIWGDRSHLWPRSNMQGPPRRRQRCAETDSRPSVDSLLKLQTPAASSEFRLPVHVLLQHVLEGPVELRGQRSEGRREGRASVEAQKESGHWECGMRI